MAGNVKWKCNGCGEIFDGSAYAKKCPDQGCQSKDITRLEDPKQDWVKLLDDGGIKSGVDLLADIILQHPSDKQHIWTTLKEHNVDTWRIRTILKAHFKMNSEELGMDELERSGIKKEKDLAKTPESDFEEELAAKRRQLKEADKTIELELINRQLEIKMQRLNQMQGGNPPNNPQGNQPSNGGNPWTQTTTIEEEVGYDEERKRPVYRKVTYPINPYTGAPMGGAPQDSGGGQPLDPLEIQTQTLETAERMVKLSKEVNPPPATGDSDAMKELKDEVKKLQDERNKDEIAAIETNFNQKLKDGLAEAKADRGNRTKDQIEAETGREFITGAMGAITEQQKTHNTKVEMLLEKGLDIVVKKMAGKDEIIKGDELEDRPPEDPPPAPPPPTTPRQPPPDPRRAPPPRRE